MAKQRKQSKPNPIHDSVVQASRGRSEVNNAKGIKSTSKQKSTSKRKSTASKGKATPVHKLSAAKSPAKTAAYAYTPYQISKFKKAHGSDFDPYSKMDRAKMNKLIGPGDTTSAAAGEKGASELYKNVNSLPRSVSSRMKEHLDPAQVERAYSNVGKNIRKEQDQYKSGYKAAKKTLSKLDRTGASNYFPDEI